MARTPNFPRGALRGAVTLQPVAPTERVLRRPRHTFYVFQRPWVIQPFLIAPVLAGETLRNIGHQSTSVSAQLARPVGAGTFTGMSPAMGWWAEVYYFYVKHRDLDGRDDFVNMHLQNGYNLSGQFVGSANQARYVYAGTVDWIGQSVKRIIETYFREAGVAWNAFKFASDNEVIASIAVADVFQSLILDSAMVGADDPTIDPTGGITASEVETALRQWEWARSLNLTPMDFEDYLGTHGIRQPRKEDEHRPELVRYIRDWQMPKQVASDTTGGGVLSHAVEWRLSERADKARIFKEPGFIVGLQVFRPKVLRTTQAGSAVGLLTHAYTWLPAVLRDDPLTSMVKQGETAGISPTITGEYWLDVRDLYLHGDQFVANLGTSVPSGVGLPNAAGDPEYASSADANALFDAGTSSLAGIVSEGVVTLTISGNVVEVTP